MRRKGFTYYKNTLVLKLANHRFFRWKDSSAYDEFVQNRRSEMEQKYNSSSLNFPEFNLQYLSYFYFDDVSSFDSSYQFEKGFPIALKGGNEVPLFPLYFGLVYINSHFNKSNFDVDLLKRIADFTLEKSTSSGDVLLLHRDFDYSIFNLKAPWVSGITQAIASSFFCRLYVLTQEKKYLENAKSFFKACTSEKYCLRSTKKGQEWVEEYLSEPSAYVLTGHIFAIVSAAELYQLTAQEQYKIHTEVWLRSLVSELSSYQYKDYIVHNKYQWKLSNIEYQGLYVGQFKHLYDLTGNDLFLELFQYYNSIMNWNSFYSFYGINK